MAYSLDLILFFFELNIVLITIAIKSNFKMQSLKCVLLQRQSYSPRLKKTTTLSYPLMMKSTTIVTPPRVILYYYFRNLVQQNDKSLMPSVMNISHTHLFNRYIYKYMENCLQQGI